ncbi:MAG: hypothetical protein MT490_19820 [Sphingomonas sp.]|uniref:hypothetical protein n=1 Tax=Sphingomonas sp. TaxID=28214 RepID=UPI00227624FF|nr:hypothetical protein [Sphingomonas sp.]MCX8478044.1 hypothetical protein [Sphingomonas sp.]
MLVRTCAALAAICLVSSAAAAQDAAQPQAATEPAKEKKICRAMTPTGSIMAKRKCMTKAEWAKFNAENERQAENFRDRRNQGGGMSSTQ